MQFALPKSVGFVKDRINPDGKGALFDADSSVCGRDSELSISGRPQVFRRIFQG